MRRISSKCLSLLLASTLLLGVGPGGLSGAFPAVALEAEPLGVVISGDEVSPMAVNRGVTKSLDTDNKKEGTGSLRLENAQTGQVDLSIWGGSGYFSTGRDIRLTGSPAISAWIYIEDVSALTQFTFEVYENTTRNILWLTSGQGYTANNFQNGWNKLMVPIPTENYAGWAEKSHDGLLYQLDGSGVALNAVTSFTVGVKLNGPGAVLLDDIKIIDLDAEPPFDPTPVELGMIFSGDTPLKMAVNGGVVATVNTTNKKAGAGSLELASFTGTDLSVWGGSSYFEVGRDIDLTGAVLPAVCAWVYIEDVANLNRLTFTVTDNEGNKAMLWLTSGAGYKEKNFKTGWNQLVVPLPNGPYTAWEEDKCGNLVYQMDGNGAALTAVASFTVGLVTNAPGTVLLDDVKITDIRVMPKPEPVMGDIATIISGSNKINMAAGDNLEVSLAAVETPTSKNSALKLSYTSQEGGSSSIWGGGPSFDCGQTIDLQDATRPALDAWIYFDDLDKISGGVFDLMDGSARIMLWFAGDNYSKELNFETGWNHVVIPLPTSDYEQWERREYGGLLYGIDGSGYFQKELSHFSIMFRFTGSTYVLLSDVKIVELGKEEEAEQPALQMSSLYADSMIFQRNKPVPFNGKAVPGATVKVSLLAPSGETIRTGAVSAGEDGNWSLELAAMEGSFTPYTVVVESEGDTILLEDVKFGELWLAAGQSNMEYFMYGTRDVTERVNDALAPANAQRSGNIRMYTIRMHSSLEDVSYDAVDSVASGVWRTADKRQNVRLMSGVAYSYAVNLYDKLNQGGVECPIGILAITRGATGIESWMSRESLDRVPEFRDTVKPYADFTNWNSSIFGDKANQATAMYNNYLFPCFSLNIGGILWYQGENNYNQYAVYGSAMKEMIRDYREKFASGEADEVIPFVNFQLAPHGVWNDPANGYPQELLGYFWDMQNALRREIDAYSIVPVYDLPLDYASDNSPIHPYDKWPLGARAADIVCAGYFDRTGDIVPDVKSVRVENGKLIITFDNVGSGLKIRGDAPSLHGFAVCGADRIFVDAKAEITGPDTISVWNPTITEPAAATYGFANFNAVSNLYNGYGIPVPPFRTDRQTSAYYSLKVWQYCDDETVWANYNAYGNSTGAYLNTWQAGTVTAGKPVVRSFDTSVKTEGTASLKLSYEAGSGAVAVEPVLEYRAADNQGIPSMYNQLEQYKTMSFDVYNPDGREKRFTGVYVKLADGTIYRLKLAEAETGASLPGGQWTTLTADLTRLYDAGDQLVEAGDLLTNVRHMQFTFADEAAGALHLDNITFGMKVLPADTKPSEPTQPSGTTNPSDTTRPTETTGPSASTGDAIPMKALAVLGVGALLAFAALLLSRLRRQTGKPSC